MTHSRAAVWMTVTVLLHLVVVLLHASAHVTLAVNMSRLQNAFIGLVIMAAPLVAAGLVWTRHRRVGALLLAVSMFGALVFGAYHHFVAPGTDHVSTVPTDGWGGLFRHTALLLAAVEAVGTGVGWWGFRRFSYNRHPVN